MQSFLPLPQSAIGVFQKWICLKYASGAFGVVLRARALGQLVHHRARLACSPASRRSRSPAGPAPSASRSTRATCRRSRGSSSSPTPSTCRASRSRPPSARGPSPAPWPPISVFVWYGHDAPITASPFLNRSISSEASAQYFLISGFCFLSRSIVAANWAGFSSYGSLIPSDGLRLHQVQRRVGDLDRVVRHGDLALVLRAVDRRPRRRRRLHLLRVVEQRVRPPLQRDAVVLAADRVVRRRLERLRRSS